MDAEDYEAILKQEGLRPEPPRRRLRNTRRSQRVKGNDPRPLAEMPLQSWTPEVTARKPRVVPTDLEAMMQGTEAVPVESRESWAREEDELWATIRTLEPGHQWIIEQLAEGNHSREIAAVLGCTKAEATTMIEEARSALAEVLGRES